MRQKFLIENPCDFQKLIRVLKPQLKAGSLLLVFGELGAGKTTFIKTLTKWLLGNDDNVTSPSFALAQVYEGKNLSILHVDGFRLKNRDSEFEAYLKEEIEAKEKIIAVEWPEKLSINWPKDALKIKIKRLKNGKRVVSIN